MTATGLVLMQAKCFIDMNRYLFAWISWTLEYIGSRWSQQATLNRLTWHDNILWQMNFVWTRNSGYCVTLYKVTEAHLTYNMMSQLQYVLMDFRSTRFKQFFIARNNGRVYRQSPCTADCIMILSSMPLNVHPNSTSMLVGFVTNGLMCWACKYFSKYSMMDQHTNHVCDCS